MLADFVSREDALEIVLPHMLDLDKESGPGLGKIGLVQTPQIFYNRNVLVSSFIVHAVALVVHFDHESTSCNLPRGMSSCA